MSQQPIKNNQAKNSETQTTVHQLEIPGMEEFLAKLKAKPKNTDNSKSQG